MRVLLSQSTSAVDWAMILELDAWAVRDETLPPRVGRALSWEVFESFPAEALERGHARWEWAELGEQLVEDDPERVSEGSIPRNRPLEVRYQSRTFVAP